MLIYMRVSRQPLRLAPTARRRPTVILNGNGTARRRWGHVEPAHRRAEVNDEYVRGLLVEVRQASRRTHIIYACCHIRHAHAFVVVDTYARTRTHARAYRCTA